jgi:predicted nucleic acid-binding protein
MEAQLKIYCDTNTLPHNIRDQKSQGELAAIMQLAEEYPMFRSLVVYREVMNTPEGTQQNNLILEYNALEPIPKDEKVLGFHTQSDQYGGCITQPLISDVQDEKICKELKRRGLKLRDAEHITQAVCNGCDVFLTRDKRTIITPHRAWLETRFPTLKVQLPSELLADLARLSVSLKRGETAFECAGDTA